MSTRQLGSIVPELQRPDIPRLVVAKAVLSTKSKIVNPSSAEGRASTKSARGDGSSQGTSSFTFPLPSPTYATGSRPEICRHRQEIYIERSRHRGKDLEASEVGPSLSGQDATHDWEAGEATGGQLGKFLRELREREISDRSERDRDLKGSEALIQ